MHVFVVMSVCLVCFCNDECLSGACLGSDVCLSDACLCSDECLSVVCVFVAMSASQSGDNTL